MTRDEISALLEPGATVTRGHFRALGTALLNVLDAADAPTANESGPEVNLNPSFNLGSRTAMRVVLGRIAEISL